MNSFDQWWEAEEVFMRAEGADDEIILGAMRNIAATAWDAALDAAAEHVEDKELAADTEWEALKGYAGIADDIRGMKND